MRYMEVWSENQALACLVMHWEGNAQMIGVFAEDLVGLDFL